MNNTAPKSSVSTPTPRRPTRSRGAMAAAAAAASAAARRAKRASLQAPPKTMHMPTLTGCSCGGEVHDHDDMYYRPAPTPSTTASDRRRSLPIMKMSTSTPVPSGSAARRRSPSRQPIFAKELVFPLAEDPKEEAARNEAAQKEAKACLMMDDSESKLRSLGLERLTIA